MQFKPRFLALALGLALAPCSALLAQDIELVTEATVTFQVTFGTSVTTNNAQTGTARIDTTRAYNSILKNQDIIRGLLGRGPTESIAGWRLAAVRPLAADLVEVDTPFALFLVNDAQNERTQVPADKFAFLGTGPAFIQDLFQSSRYAPSVTNAVITHSTRNIITGQGTIVENVAVNFTPGFIRKEVPEVITQTGSEFINGQNRNFNVFTKIESAFTLDYLSSNGFSTIGFKTRAIEHVFSFPLDTVRFNGTGDFTGILLNTVTRTKKYTTRGLADVELSKTVDSSPTPALGLAYVQINVLKAKLVDHALYPYPAVSF